MTHDHGQDQGEAQSGEGTPAGRVSPNHGKRSNGRYVLAAALGLIAGVVIDNVGSIAFGAVISVFNKPAAEITTLASDTVPMTFGLEGTFKNVPASELLWAVNRAQSNNRWHPQPEACTKLIDGMFSCGKMYLGVQDESDKSEVFDIVIVGADPSAVREFSRYDKEVVNEDPENPTYPGLPTLPSGTRILDQERVIRE